MTQEEIWDVVENKWLGLGDPSKIRTENPLVPMTAEDIERPVEHFVSIMRRQEYLWFTTKHALNKTLMPFQTAILRELWLRPFPMLIGSRGLGKTWLLAIYCLLRALVCQGIKIVCVGSGFRQAKFVFENCVEVWRNAPILRSIVGEGQGRGPRHDIDRCHFVIGESIIVFLPIGDGSKIRGQRANVLVAEEFASQSEHIFDTVVSPFAAVAMDPVEKVRSVAREEAMIELGLAVPVTDATTVPGLNSNQTILSGTAFYSFNHFFKNFTKYKRIIESRGDRRKLEEVFGGPAPDGFDWRSYSIVRMPSRLLPRGFLDEKIVANQKAKLHLAQYLMEFGACFIGDSNGFFKRSLLEKCVVGGTEHVVIHPSCGTVDFSASLKGHPDRKYVMAVDPASEQDNFSVVCLEVWPDHRRCLFCWTTTRARYRKKFAKGMVKETSFYSFAARKIRELAKLFPCEEISIDSQGGGVAVMEALADVNQLEEGESPFLPIIDEEKEKPTDDMTGDHLLVVVNFADSSWVSEANHGMRKDLEDRTLLFPAYDSATIGLAIEEDKMTGRVKATAEGDEKLYDTLEDCALELCEMIEECATIVHSQTGTAMRDKWDTPEIKTAENKKGRLRKDRYSALLMANMSARTLSRRVKAEGYDYLGGYVGELAKREERAEKRGARLSQRQNPEWYTRMLGGGGHMGRVEK